MEKTSQVYLPYYMIHRTKDGHKKVNRITNVPNRYKVGHRHVVRQDTDLL